MNSVLWWIPLACIIMPLSAHSSNTELTIGFGVSDYHFEEINDSDIDKRGGGFNVNLIHYPWNYTTDNSELKLGLGAGFTHFGSFSGTLMTDKAPRELVSQIMAPGSGFSLLAAGKYQYGLWSTTLSIGQLYWSNNVRINDNSYNSKDTSTILGINLGYDILEKTTISTGVSFSEYNNNKSMLFLAQLTFSL
ncbi:hypothetical protein [Vibrio campbellii]|uniref:hypothetical protein n=1 Tax=Vibrio campbellii TaxID=680 RepID=UPI00142E0BB1|nr:hypothetical protein [Vibrio campbellii]NIY90562.1 hypothetical protein [Vibrio campbellii]